MIAWCYRQWVALLAFGDLLGADGRPSQSKLASLTVLWVGCFVALWAVVKHSATGPGGGAVTLIIAGLAASFGRSMLARFIARYSAASSVTSVDQTVRAIAERRDQDAGVEPSP